ncbi:MAG: hypothetical protein HQK50_02790 [Oligoflexia bacterium]|nr:hypothetical protein [Oligoflexia bacterium]MBF0364468.1 hypothetical protein [Oligoflexia bacterium]
MENIEKRLKREEEEKVRSGAELTLSLQGPVYLLLEEVESALKISNALRKMGLLSYYFKELNDFWNAAIGHIPAFAIVDVKKMSDGNLVLREHPLILSNSLRVAFFYTETTRPLLVSTSEFAHFGLIEKGNFDFFEKEDHEQLAEDYYTQTLNVVCKRVDKISAGDEINSKLQEQNTILRKKNQQLQENLQKMREESKTQSQIINILNANASKGRYGGRENFWEFVVDVLDRWPDVELFSIAYLDTKEKEVVSPVINHPRYRALETISIAGSSRSSYKGKNSGQALFKGMSEALQDQMFEIALTTFGHDCNPLFLYGRSFFPDAIIFLGERKGRVPSWKTMEMLFQVQYRMLVMEKDSLENFMSDKQITPWKMLGMLENPTLLHCKKNALFDIDFQGLYELVVDNELWTFDWAQWTSDFIAKMLVATAVDFYYASTGIYHIAILVDDKDANRLKEDLQKAILSFPHDKYFNDHDQNLEFVLMGIVPELNRVSSRVEEYFRYLNLE